MFRLATKLLTLAAFSFGLSSSQTITEIVVANGNLSSLLTYVQAAGLGDALAGEGNFTLFAPDNDAFDALPNATASRLLEPEWSPHLTGLLQYHVLGTEVFSSGLVDGAEVPTLLPGSNVTVSTDPPRINDANVIEADIDASNGVVHIIDAVLVPPFLETNVVEIAQSDTSFSFLVQALESAGLVDALKAPGPFTVLAPLNTAFEAIANVIPTLTIDQVRNILLYHVVPSNIVSSSLSDGDTYETLLAGYDITVSVDGENVTINNSTAVVAGDILASNGVIHAIDEVLIPPGFLESGTGVPATSPPTMPPVANATDESLADLVAGNGNLTTLFSLVEAVNATELFANSSYISTLFAPTDEAFQAVPAETLQRLLQPVWIYHLASVLLYHVVSGEIFSSDLVDGETVQTLEGNNVTVSTNPPRINEANVIEADLEASNGVMHVIDAVLLPPSALYNIVQLGQMDSTFSTLVDLVESYNLTAALSGPGPLTLFAPPNTAFEAISDILPNLSPAQVTDVLLYHVANGIYVSDNVENGTEIPTSLEGESVQFLVSEDVGPTVNNVPITEYDILATNGVVHVVSQVLIPPSLAATGLPASSAPSPAGTEATGMPTSASSPAGTEATGMPTSASSPAGTEATGMPTSASSPAGTESTGMPTSASSPAGTEATGMPTSASSPAGTEATGMPTSAPSGPSTPSPSGGTDTDMPTSMPSMSPAPVPVPAPDSGAGGETPLFHITWLFASLVALLVM